MSKRRPLVRFVLWVLLAVVVAIVICYGLLTQQIELNSDRSAYVPPGSSISRALQAIDRSQHLPTPWLTQLTARIVAKVTHRPIHAGWYRFEQGDTQLDVIKALFSGHRRPVIKVMIPEGKNYREVASILHRQADIDSLAFVNWAENDSVCENYHAQAGSMEGYLLPNTYQMFWREPAPQAGNRLAKAFRTAWMKNAEGLLGSAGRTYHEVITLASIVQAEAANVDEMPRIAGVYANRIDRGMKLEADPTVQYALGSKRRLLYRDLDVANPYNTYRVTGLPPGPINNPGMEAIKAALRPEQNEYLFFVARGDGSGKHYFARTGSEHERNVLIYRKTRR